MQLSRTERRTLRIARAAVRHWREEQAELDASRARLMLEPEAYLRDLSPEARWESLSSAVHRCEEIIEFWKRIAALLEWKKRQTAKPVQAVVYDYTQAAASFEATV